MHVLHFSNLVLPLCAIELSSNKLPMWALGFLCLIFGTTFMCQLAAIAHSFFLYWESEIGYTYSFSHCHLWPSNLRTMVLSVTNIKLCLCLLHSLLEHFNWVKRIRFLFFSSKLNTNHGGEKVHAHAKLNGITCITSQE